MAIRREDQSAAHMPRSASLVFAVLRHPLLWPAALRLAWSARRPKWWASAPFLPLPSRGYLTFRFETQYGASAATDTSPHDVVEYLKWVRRSAH